LQESLVEQEYDIQEKFFIAEIYRTVVRTTKINAQSRTPVESHRWFVCFGKRRTTRSKNSSLESSGICRRAT
jgi:hypothetical protein